MNKPIILVEQEMKEELVEMINRYTKELPITIVITMLSDCANSLMQLKEKQLAEAMEKYRESEEKTDA